MVHAAPPFVATVSPVTAAQLGASWHPGCPVGPSQLRRVRISYWDFDGRRHVGALDAYGGSDERSMAADNTSGFNCRYASAPGPRRWSAHAYGEAIDVDTVENPYVQGSLVRPLAGRAYLDRSRYRKGMAVAGGVLVHAFAAVGWQWGGRWS